MRLPNVSDDDIGGVMPCPACPDGYVWTSNGPTSRPCPSCGGFAAVHMDGSKLTQAEYDRLDDEQEPRT